MLKSACRSATFLFFFSLIIVFSNSVNAGNAVVFERSFNIGEWHMHASQHTFSADDAGNGILTISKNNSQGEVQHGFLVLNSALIFLGDFLAGDELVFEKEIAIKATNSLIIFLLGDPGASISVQISGNESPVTPPQIIAFTADPATIKRGESATLTWQTTHADSCVIEPGIGTVGPSGSIPVVPTGTTNYTLTAEGTGDPVTATVTVTIENSAPMANAGPDRGVFVGDTVTLDGSGSTDVDQDPLNYNWSFITIPQKSTTVLSGSSVVNPAFIPDIAGIYEIQLIVNDGEFNSPSDQVIITANPRMVAVPNVIGMLQADAEAAILADKLVMGAINFEHSETTAQNDVINQSPVAGTSVPEGSAVDLTISLGSENQPPTVSFTASPATIAQGGSATLSWTSLRAKSAHIDNDIGSVPVEGTIEIYPEHTSTYTITVTGQAGSANARVIVQVTGTPEPQPEGSYGEQYEDQVPPDATVDQYDPKRFSLITGLVHDINQHALPGVTITVHSHAQYGHVTTDDQGRFSIPVEGGGNLTVVYQKQGLISVQRKVYVPWNDNAIAETVVMIAEDPMATTLTFDDDPNTVITHKSAEITDESGTRAVTMVFSGDNKAYLVDEQGNDVQQLTTITSRATEYPTPESMPAKLPPTSAFTYCAELSVDGAQRVRFDKPITTFIDNFLGFPVGSIVPVGYYDRDKGVWVPSENGVVVKLLDTDGNGEADALDSDGDGQPNDLDFDGSFVSEVKGLGDSQRYAPGATFWRVQMKHLTPFDCNWPGGPPQDAIAPNAIGFPQADAQIANGTDPKRYICSFVEEKSRIFHEDIPIPGTDITLHYASSRVAGYKPGVFTIPASGDMVPESLIRIDVLVDIAGKQYSVKLPPTPNQIAEIEWDGRDHLGRPVAGAVVAHVRIGFVYYGVYYLPSPVGQAFGQPGLGTVEINSREEIIFWTESAIPIIRGKGTIAEGWTLSLHHQVSPLDPSTIIKGDGTVNNNNVNIIDTYAGTGQLGFENLDGPATEANIGYATNVEADSAGNLYIGTGEVLGFHWWDYRILKVGTDGNITTAVYSPHDTNFAIDAQGNFYDPFYSDSCVFKIDSEGKSTRVAGICDVNRQGFSGDGGPATAARLNYPGGVDPDNDDNLYIADTHNHRIRKVDVNGIITTVAGSGPSGSSGGGFSGDGGLATEAMLRYPADVAVDKAGNLFIADGQGRVRKVDPSGIITTVAGNGTSSYAGDGVLATETGLYSIEKVEVDAAGNLYVVSYLAHRVWKVDASGIITTVAGSGPTNAGAFDGDGGPATSARLNRPNDVAIDAAGNIFIADNQNYRIRKVSPPSSRLKGAMSESDIAFTEENGIGYIMSSAGLHKKTIDLNTGVSLYEFGYDEENNLVFITDQFGNLTNIERDDTGRPTAIVSPFGIQTGLTIDSSNRLTQIVYPDGSLYKFDYSLDDLLELKTQPESNRFGHIFDSDGRITDFTDDEGGHWLFSRTVLENGDILHTTQTAEGDLTSYLDRTSSTGAFESTIADPANEQTHYSQSQDGLTVDLTLPCGDEQVIQYNVDPEYTYKFIGGLTEIMPSGLTRFTSSKRIYEDSNEDGIPERITEYLTSNDKEARLVHDVSQAARALTSPEGRTITSFYDPDTLATESVSIPGLHDTSYQYNPEGKLISVKTSARETKFTYDAFGHLESVTDPENHVTKYITKPVGRIERIDRPDGSSLFFDYDFNGNMLLLVNPEGAEHRFTFNKVNLNNSYETPLSGSYLYEFNADRQLTKTTFPSGKQIINTYEDALLKKTRTPEEDIDYTYSCGSKVETVTKGYDTIVYGYDGSLITSEIFGGTLDQDIIYTYNNDFNLASMTYAGVTLNYAYDNDALLTVAGSYAISRNTENGLPESVSDSALNLARTFNGYGEVEGQHVNVGGQNVVAWNLTRDNNGRILQKTETVGGITANYSYTYDPLGRLLTVTKDGALTEEYRYDVDGTRRYEMNVLRGISGRNFVYSDEDHLLASGDMKYEFDPDGFLTSKTDLTNSANKTHYDYSFRGELLRVDLPDGRVVEYLHDPLGRRIAKKINGVIVEKYLWQVMTRLLAVYDGADNLLMRFDYADDRMPVSLTTEGAIYYLAYDQVGSLRAVADSSGNVVKGIEYDSFGNIIADTNEAFEIPFGFAGGLHDRDTGLVKFGVRDYDPDVGRWTAKDPIFFAGGDTDLYGYVLNDPINLIDPIGLKVYGTITISGGGALAIFGGEGGAIIAIDIDSGKLHAYNFAAGGVGLGFGGAATAQVGLLEMDDPKDIAGWGLEASGFAAAIHGASGQIHGSGPFGNGAAGAAVGYAAGVGAGVSGMLTYTWYRGEYDLKNLPYDVLSIINPYLQELKSLYRPCR
jgi:RHS repeat-associated protein